MAAARLEWREEEKFQHSERERYRLGTERLEGTASAGQHT